jgi:hypothetical protein
MGIETVLFDIEGVLVEKAGKSVNPIFFHHIQGGHKEIPFAVCTGRPQPYAERVLQELGPRAMGKVPSIVENGCFLMEGSVLNHHPKLDGNMHALSSIKATLAEKFFGQATIEPGKEVCISLRPKTMDVKALFQDVLKVVDLYGWTKVVVAHSNSAVDVTPVGITKGAGLEYWSDVTGISSADVLGIGDANNDMEWLARVGTPACPANASDDIKSLVVNRGGYVATSPYESGTLEILKHFKVL